MSEFFKPEDFGNLSVCAGIANKILKERGTVVYGNVGSVTDEFMWKVKHIGIDTHQALLINIEELPRKECEHSPGLDSNWKNILGYHCTICGIKLKPGSWTKA